MPTNRHQPGVIQAFAVGAVACEHCKQVHVDMVDKDMNVIATGSINFDQWIVLTLEVERQLNEIVDGGKWNADPAATPPS